MPKFQEGQKVKVIADYEDPQPDSPWVGAIGIVQQYNAFDRDYTIQVTSGNVYPEDGDLAWFAENELQLCEN